MQDPLLKLPPNCCDVIVFDQDLIRFFLHQKTTEHSKSLQNIFAFTMINCVKQLTKICISYIGDDSTALLI